MTLHTFEIPGFLAYVDLTAIPWRSTRYEGIEWHRLTAREESTRDSADGSAVLIRMAPGRGYPGHRHLGPEDVLILTGGYRDELGVHAAGTYLRYSAGSEHNPVALGSSREPEGPSNPSCVLFALTRGTQDLVGPADGADPLPAARGR